ncbi:MAG: hypothetical protein ABIR53_06505 [Paraperlucidibaca sp.]
MSVARFQARIGVALIGVFIVGLVVLNARTPERVEMNEQELGNIVRDSETEFKVGFGAFPELVPDNGGDQPVPFDGLAPQRYPQYRSEQWLADQPAAGFTIQLGVFSSERAATDFMVSHGNSADLRYFELPEMPDPALGLVTAAKSRFTVTYGEFFSSDQAVVVAESLTGYGQQFLVRPWQSYQVTLAAVKAVLARNLLAQQEALARAQAAADASAAAPAVQSYQGVDPVEALQKKQSKPQ